MKFQYNRTPAQSSLKTTLKTNSQTLKVSGEAYENVCSRVCKNRGCMEVKTGFCGRGYK